MFAKNYSHQNNNFKIIINKNNIFSYYFIKQSYKFELSQNYLILYVIYNTLKSMVDLIIMSHFSAYNKLSKSAVRIALAALV